MKSSQNIGSDESPDNYNEADDNNDQCHYFYLQTNPLLIDTVLYQLMLYFGLEDLKTFRLVHSSWNRAVTPRLKRCCRVVFRPVRPEEEEELNLLAACQYPNFNGEKSCLIPGTSCIQTMKDVNERIASFTNTFSNSLEMFGDSPFTEFKLIDFPFGSEIGSNFFQVCGKHIKAVDIRVNRKGNSKLPSTFGGDFYPNLLSSKIPFLRKLVLFPYPGMEKSLFPEVIPSLELIHFKEWASKELLYPEKFLENLLEKAIRLRTIWVSIGLENCKSVENILIAVASTGRYSFLTKLHIAYLRLSQLEILHELALQRRNRLRLRSFRIEALAHDVPTSLFEAFLRTQSVNMEEFYCRRFMGSSKFGKFTFPRMLGLKKLDCELSARQTMPLRCNTRFPNLKTLKLFGTCCQVFSFDMQFCGNRISESLTTLHFRPGLIVTGSITGLAEHFPCLKSLTLSIISGEDLRQLLQCWEMLEDLELYFSDAITNIDSIMTGMSVERCRLVQRLLKVIARTDLLQKLKDGTDLMNMTDAFLEDIQDFSMFFEEVSLRNFKNLKTIHLEYNAFLMSRNQVGNGEENQSDSKDSNSQDQNGNNNSDSDDSNSRREESSPSILLSEESYLPSDLTGYFALAQMKSLRRVSLPECLFSKECCNTLIETMGLVSWNFCSEASDIVTPK